MTISSTRGIQQSILAAASVLAGSLVHAQSDASGNDRNAAASDRPALEEVVVTAQKRTERLLDVPAAVTALATDDLLAKGALRLEDYQAYVPGLSTTPLAPGWNQITLRGVTTGSSQLSATVATYFDEAPTNSSSGTAWGSRLTPDPDLLDVERIEVLRGPQGTLFGANALGGVIRYVLVAPRLDGFQGRVQAGFSSVDHGEVGHVARGAVSGPLIEGVLGMRFSGFRSEDPGYIDNPTTGKNDVNRSTSSGARLAFLWKPTEQFSAAFSSLYQDRNNEGLPSETVNAATLVPSAGPYQQTVVTDEFVRTRYQLHSLTLNADLGFAALTSASNYGHQESSLAQDDSPAFSFLVPATNQRVPVDLKKFTQELRLTSPGGKRFEYIVGAYYTHESALAALDITGFLASKDPAPPPINPIMYIPLSSVYEEIAIFANTSLNFTDRLALQAGMRWSRPEHRFAETVNGQAYGSLSGSTFLGEASETAVTFSVSPQFKITPNTNLYARIAKGFRPGAANVIPPIQFGAVPATYAADTLLNYEFGLKTSVVEHRLNLSLAAFQINWEDIQTTGFAGTFPYLFNGGKARSRGVEGEARWSIGELTLGANASYTDAETLDSMIAVGAKAGDQLPNSPRWSGALTTDYQFRLGAQTTATAGASLRYSGKRQAFYSLATESNPANVALDDYALLDLRVGLRRGRYELSAFVQNVTDKHAILAVDTSAVNPATWDGASATLARPRTVGLTIGVDF